MKLRTILIAITLWLFIFSANAQLKPGVVAKGSIASAEMLKNHFNSEDKTAAYTSIVLSVSGKFVVCQLPDGSQFTMEVKDGEPVFGVQIFLGTITARTNNYMPLKKVFMFSVLQSAGEFCELPAKDPKVDFPKLQFALIKFNDGYFFVGIAEPSGNNISIISDDNQEYILDKSGKLITGDEKHKPGSKVDLTCMIYLRVKA